MKADELFDRCVQLATSEPDVAARRMMHETLVLCCAEGTKEAGGAFGNLFSQVDYLCKRHGMRTADRLAVQAMRRHSNRNEPLSHEDWLYDVRALALFVQTVMSVDVPGRLLGLIPTENRLPEDGHHVDVRYVRCIVSRREGQTVVVQTEQGELRADFSEQAEALRLLREGMQLNLLDCQEGSETKGGERVVRPGLVVLEPDFLIDISALARCFNGYGHHPLLYTIERLKPRANTQAILLGNLAGAMLDDIINDPGFTLADTVRTSFREQALQFCTCGDFNGERFVADAHVQAANIKEAVSELFSKSDRSQALLEPSFICERLGLQGRVDLMTTDMQLLVEQKSGKNFRIERMKDGEAEAWRSAGTEKWLYKEDHYVQLLLYYGILRYNFGRSESRADIRLLYSRYPARKGLLYVNFYHQLFREAIGLRNQIVATELLIARDGFGHILPCLNPTEVFKNAQKDGFFHQYIEPEVSQLATLLSQLTPLERAYYERMLTFVYREQLLSKVGRQEGLGGAVADLWNMPLSEKLETGSIYLGLTISNRQKSEGQHGYDLITLTTAADAAADAPSKNFRRGDMVWLYAYEGEPDVRQAILYKGTLVQLAPTQLVVQLNDGQQNAEVMVGGTWAIEHAGSDLNTTSAIKSLHQLMQAGARKKALLLGQREPECDTSLRLTRSYHPSYDNVLLGVRQARDYYLLVWNAEVGRSERGDDIPFLRGQGLTDFVAEDLAKPVEVCAEP